VNPIEGQAIALANPKHDSGGIDRMAAINARR